LEAISVGDEVVFLYEESAIMLIDDHSRSLSPKLECSPVQSLQKSSRKHGIV
jgi:hypothetical protein